MFDARWVTKYLPQSLCDNSERTAFCALAACISVVLVSIAASQILLAFTIAGFIWVLRKHSDFGPMRMKYLLPLLVFMAWTLVAVFASSKVIVGLEVSKKFYLYLLVPMVPLIVRGRGRVKWIYKGIFLFAVISSLRGLAQFAANPNRDLLHRISGFMSQWMTYSGLLMLALILLVAYALVEGVRKNLWTIPAAVCIALAILFSQTRNAWMGAVAGITLLILLWRPKAFVLLCAAILACYFISPSVRERFKSGLDPNDPNTRNRIELFETSVRLIHDHPWLGVGPKNVKYDALKYRGNNEFPDWMYQHMHNNFLQIAAETGIPGLLIWLWFMGRIGWDSLACFRMAKSSGFPYDQECRKEALMVSSAALASWLALILAGLFEYNFGDSEVLTLFLFIVSAPYAFMKKHAAAFTPSEIERVNP